MISDMRAPNGGPNLEMFRYPLEKPLLTLSIGKEVKKHSRSGVTAVSNTVQLHFCDLQLDNSYTALSALQSLVTIFVRRQFDQNKKRAHIGFAHEMDIIYFIIEKRPGKDGARPQLRIWPHGQDMAIHLYQGNIYQLDSALRKAMNWISPMPVVDSS